MEGNLSNLKQIERKKHLTALIEEIIYIGHESIGYLDKDYTNLFYLTVDRFYEFKQTYEELVTYCGEENNEDNLQDKNK